LRAISLFGEGPKPGRDYFSGCARGRGVSGFSGIQGVYKPGPRDFGQKRVEPDLDLKWGHRKTDHAKGTIPALGFRWIVEKDKPPRAQRRIVAVLNGPDIGG
jgi:hypothetical protein